MNQIGQLTAINGESLVGDTILLMLNAHHEAISFILPVAKAEHHWLLMLDTAKSVIEPADLEPGKPFQLQGRSVAVFRTKEKMKTEPVSTAQRDNLRQETHKSASPQDEPLMV